ncbi:TPA: hypothetical protein JLG68_001369 [Escherichia coli]|nr:hypothetical protein [Escherichia coli]
MEYNDISKMLDAKAAREAALSEAKQISIDVDALNLEMKRILTNRLYHLQFIVKDIFSNLPAYGLGQLEEAVNAIALEIWKRQNDQDATRLEEINKQLSELNHKHTEAISEACQISPFKVATTDQMKLRDEVAEQIYNNTGIC